MQIKYLDKNYCNNKQDFTFNICKYTNTSTLPVKYNKGIKVPMKTSFDSDNNFNHQIF